MSYGKFTILLMWALFWGCNGEGFRNGDPLKGGSGSSDSEVERTDADPPVAVTATNLVDLNNGALGVEVEFVSPVEATVYVKWLVKKESPTQKGVTTLVDSDGFADSVTVDNVLLITLNGEDISPGCIKSANAQQTVCEHRKVASSQIAVTATASLVDMATKERREISAPSEFVIKGSPVKTPAQALYMVGVYEGPVSGTVTVRVNSGKPTALAFTSYSAIKWTLVLSAGTTITDIILHGYDLQTVTNAPSSASKVESHYPANYVDLFGGSTWFYSNPSGPSTVFQNYVKGPSIGLNIPPNGIFAAYTAPAAIKFP